jgi:molybdopterin/thiamine biosynthesis adenylyltransferase
MAHIVVVGAGTIGSHVLPHIARMPDVTDVTVIDRDRYERSNLAAQNIYESDAGKSKAQLQARRLRQIDHSLRVRAVHAPIEDVPLGWVRADAILACLDSRQARMAVNQMAWRLGVPWINAGIDPSGLARVQGFIPSAQAACLECAWDTRDYELVEQDYPCQDNQAPPETMAAAELGALAAALQAIECRKLISDRDDLLVDRDLMLDARHHRHYVTSFQRNASCRMPDHEGWSIERCDVDPASTTLGELVTIAEGRVGRDARMRVAGQQFAVTQECRSCRERQPAGFVHRGARRRSAERCPRCNGDRFISGFDARDAVGFDELLPASRNRSLLELGLLPGDVLTLTPGSGGVDVHLELSGASWLIEF